MKHHPPKAVSQGVIVNALRQDIIEGRLTPGARVPTYDDLQRRFDTTRMTVHRACQQLGSLGFVQSRAKIGTYVVDRPPHLYRYAIAFPYHARGDERFRWSRFYDALKIAASRIVGKGPRQFVFFENVDGHPDNEDYQSLLRELRAKRLAGVMFPFLSKEMVTTAIFDDSSTPMVRAGSYDGFLPYSVCVDPTSVLRRSMELFAQRGRRRVGLLTIFNRETDRLLERKVGLERLGLRTMPFWTMGVEPRNPQWVMHAIAGILKSHAPDRPDALIVDDDYLLRPAVAALRELGMRVPEDVMVIGHWNFPLPARNTEGVTLIGYDAREIVMRSMEVIDQVRRDERAPKIVDVTARFADELISTAAVASPVLVEDLR